MRMFDYDRDRDNRLRNEKNLTQAKYIYVGCGRYRYVGDEIWLRNYLQKSTIGELSIWILELSSEEIINNQQNIILKLQNENRRLKRENWNLKKTKGRRKWRNDYITKNGNKNLERKWEKKLMAII